MRRVKQVLIDRYGTPWDVARCADVPDVGEPAADEVVFDVLAFPINPAGFIPARRPSISASRHRNSPWSKSDSSRS